MNQAIEKIKTRREYKPFPVEALPPILGGYCTAAADAIGCDPALVALPALAAAASAIGNSRAVLLKRSWNEPSQLWTATVAPSGACKSPAYAKAVDPYMGLQMDQLEAESEPPIFITSDATIEAVGKRLQESPKGLLLARDELDGWFQSLVRYRGRGGGTDRAQWLELQRAGTLRVDRVGRDPINVRRAGISICGTIQPGILAHAFNDDAMDAGLAARFLLAMPPARRHRWTEADVEDQLADRYKRLLTNLLGLTLANEKKRTPHFVGLAPDAKSEWVAWYNAWGDIQHQSEGEQKALLSKLVGYAARLALVHHVVSKAADSVFDPQPVTRRSVKAGINLANWFASEAIRIYALLKETETQRARRQLIEWIAEQGGKTTVRNLQRSNGRRWTDSESAKAALDDLVKAEAGTWVERPPPPQGGHRECWFELHRPTADASDARPEQDLPEEDASSDSRADTWPPDARFSSENDRASEVSDVGESEQDSREDGGDWVAPGAECLHTPFSTN
jgi:hypothetical protein